MTKPKPATSRQTRISEGEAKMKTERPYWHNRTPIKDIPSSYIQREAVAMGIAHARFIALGGAGESYITVWGLTGSDGIEFRVANTNAEPVWEEQDAGEFAELLAEVGIRI